jgi:glycosyltransferase involved in cell wall biosynthesis
MKRILVLSRSVVGSSMSAPGIRAYHMAQVLGRCVPDAEVTLGAPDYSDVEPEPEFKVVKYSRASLNWLFYRYDIVISLSFPPLSLPAMARRHFVLDFFSNFAMEWMEVARSQRNPRKRWVWYETQRQYMNLQFTVADFIICNNERQRDFFIGALQSLGLITGQVYDRDHSVRRLIDSCPHGIRPEAKNDERGTMNDEPGTDLARSSFIVHRSSFPPGVEPGDTVLLWNAGMVGWYDPVTAIRAVHALSRERPDVKLVCIGSRYPDPGFPAEDPTFRAAIDCAEQLGVADRHVFFVRGWLPYEEVKQYLLGSYLGLSTYFNNAETHYSHRTRFLDLIWAELPIVCTRGDILSEMVEQRGLGIAVPEGDVEAVTGALRRLLDDRAFYAVCVENLRVLKRELNWEQTLAPLVEFCRDPRPIAVTKSKRLMPIVRRTAGYLFWRLAGKLVR